MSDVDIDSLMLNGQTLHSELRDAISAATITRTIDSSPTLAVTIEDKDRTLLRSGYFSQRLTAQVDDHSFELAQLSKKKNQLKITMEDLAVAELRRHNTPRAAAAGTMTRVQFVRQILSTETPWIQLFVDPSVTEVVAVGALARGTVSLSTGGTTSSADPNYFASGSSTTKTGTVSTGTGIGALSLGQQQFVTGIVAATGLNTSTVTAWVGAESGWSVTKANSNYLNVGPGRSYASVAAAVSATVSVIRQSNMAGILASVSKSPSAQVAAIAAAPWDAGHYAKAGGGTTIATILSQLPANALGAVQNLSPAENDDPSTKGLEDSWTCFKRIFSEVKWRLYADKGNLYAGPDSAFINKTPAYIFNEFDSGVNYIDFDYDVGKPVGTATIDCRATRWVAPPGTVIQLNNMALPALWLVSSITRSLFTVDTTLILTSPQPELSEASVASASDYFGDPATPPPSSSTPATAAGQATDGKYIWPVNSRTITTAFGVVENAGRAGAHIHQGLDISCGNGTAIVASRAGTVTIANGTYDPSGYGNLVIINHGDGAETRYGHLSSFSCRAGLQVTQGQQIALSGHSGDATGPHLHFEVRINGTPKDPLTFLSDSKNNQIVASTNTPIVVPNGQGGATIYQNSIPNF